MVFEKPHALSSEVKHNSILKKKSRTSKKKTQTDIVECLELKFWPVEEELQFHIEIE